MAFKPIQPSSSTTCVSVLDPSIDFEASVKKDYEGTDVLSYAIDRLGKPSSWRDTVKPKQGEQLTEFVVGVMPPAELARIEDECKLGTESARYNEAFWRCFLCGVRDVLNGPTSERKVDGVLRRCVPKKLVDGVEYADPEWLRTTFVGSLRKVAIEIGQVVYAWNQITVDETKN